MGFITINEKNKIEEYFYNKKMYTEYYLFLIAINTGISVSELVVIKNNESFKEEIKSGKISIKNKNYFISSYVQDLFYKLSKENNEYIFNNRHKKNKYNRSIFNYALASATIECECKKKIVNKDCRKTFAYYYLFSTGDIEYLKYIFNKNTKEIFSFIFEDVEIDVKDFKIWGELSYEI